MTDEETSKGNSEERSYYNVEKYARARGKSSPRPTSVLSVIVRRFSGVYDSFEGLWTMLAGFPFVILLPFGLLMLGLVFGVLAFYGGLVATAAIGTYAIEKKSGRHMHFEEISLWKRTVILVPGFLLALAVLALVFYLSGRLTP